MKTKRVLIPLIVAILFITTVGCAITSSFGKKEVTPETVAARPTLHPTFTPSPVRPTQPPPPTASTSQQALPTATTESAVEATAAPTDTPPPPSPTPVPPTPTPSTPQVEVTANTVNLRGGPGTNYPRLGKVVKGTKLDIIARNQAGDWFQIKTAEGKTAWIINDKRWTRPLAEVGAIVIAQNIPTPPPTPKPRPTNTPAPTNTPVPSYPFQASGPLANASGNAFLNIFAAVQSKDGSWLAGYRLQTKRSGADAGYSEVSRPGPSDATCPDCGDNRKQNLKYEYPNQAPADWEVWLVDGGGNQVSNTIKFSTNPSNLQWFFIQFTTK
ncbi:MAG: SH3 domain-containing protein [Chloroflexi bacterium]|nr:SH3 domain-containing protein [Chloroflexota bacterium]